MVKYLGTHNSGTSSKLVWWQRPFGYLLNLTSRCQTLSIEEQLKNNVRLFNLQVTFYNDECVFSHGLCIYTGKLLDAIESMKQYATKESPVYFQLFLDKNFLLGQNKEAFKKLVFDLLNDLRDTNVYMVYAYIEGSNEYPHRNGNIKINTSEHYWTTSWAKVNAKSWIDKLPLPKRHAKIYNDKYMEENKADYLMLDFIEIGKHFIEIGNHFINAGNKTTTTSKKPVTTTTSSKYPVTTTTTWYPTTTTSHRPTTTTTSFPTTWYPTTTTSVNPIYATVAPVTFKINNVTYKSGSSLQITPATKITLSCLTSAATIYYSINGGNQCLYDGPISVYNSCTIDAYAIKATDYINHIYYGPSGHTNITLNVISTTTTYGPTTTTTWYPTTTTWLPTTTTWFPTTTTSNEPIYHTWPPVLFKSSDGKQKNNVLIKGICGKETIVVSQLPYTTTFAYDSNEPVRFVCDNNGVLYYRKKDSTSAVKVGNKEFTASELYNLVIIYKEKSVVTTTTTWLPTTTTTWYPTTTTWGPTTTTTWYPTTTTSHRPTTTTSHRPTTTTPWPTTTWYPTTTNIPLCLNVHFNGNNYVYKHDDHRIWTDGRKFSLIFDRYFVQSWNESFNINYDSSLTNVNTDIVSDGGYSGCLCIMGDIYGASYMHHIYLTVNSTTTTYPTTTTSWYPTTTTTYRPTTTTPWPWTTTTWLPTTTTTWHPTTTTWRPTTTTTIIYDGNSPAGNGNPRPTTTTSSKYPVTTTTTSHRPTTTTPWPWTTTTWRPTTTTWLPTTTPWPWTTTTSFPTTTTSSKYPVTTTTTEAGRLEMVVDNKKYLFKNGLNFSVTLNVGESKMIMFDTVNGYPAPNNMMAISDNSSIALSSLSIFYRNITISGVKPGKTKIYVATTYKDAHYEGYINVTVNSVTTTTSKRPVTTTTTWRPTTTTSSKYPVTTTWRPTTTTWLPTTTTWRPTTTTTYF